MICTKSGYRLHVQSFYRDRLDAGLAPASVNKLHMVLHKALSQALRWQMIPRSATEAVKAPRPAPEEMRTFSAAETRKLLAAARGDRLEALYVLAVTTGMRQGELLALKWKDVDLENARLSVRRTITKSGGRLLLGEPKTKNSRRTIHLTEASVRALHEHLARQVAQIERLGDLYRDEGLIFASEVGTLTNPTNLRKRSFASLLKRAALQHIRFHDLRHAAALKERPPEDSPGDAGARDRSHHPRHLQPRFARNGRSGGNSNGERALVRLFEVFRSRGPAKTCF